MFHVRFLDRIITDFYFESCDINENKEFTTFYKCKRQEDIGWTNFHINLYHNLALTQSIYYADESEMIIVPTKFIKVIEEYFEQKFNKDSWFYKTKKEAEDEREKLDAQAKAEAETRQRIEKEKKEQELLDKTSTVKKKKTLMQRIMLYFFAKEI